MRKILEVLCITGIFIALLSGCSNCNENEKEAQSSVTDSIIINNENEKEAQSPMTDSIIINNVHVTEQPLYKSLFRIFTKEKKGSKIREKEKR